MIRCGCGRFRRVTSRVKGTPTDCVIMGVRKLMLDHPPDLLISGVNCGQNIAEDVSYSGTIAGAMEGTILGIPSIALSQVYDFFADRQTVHWECAATHGAEIVRRLLAAGIPRNVLMNVNFPNCPPQDVAGVAITMQGRRSSDIMRIEDRKDGRGNPYHWISFQRGDFKPGQGTDLLALEEEEDLDHAAAARFHRSPDRDAARGGLREREMTGDAGARQAG